ncbi:MAG: hypothetical protein J6S19_00500 [Lentisphaeria bacterium]|nr:hypothetical protein [Lentisphaeria bacterium]
MKIQYKNFKGKVYFVRETHTKTGKIKYVCSTKESVSDLEVLPDGMEFYEKASGLVGIRKKLVSKITDAEYQFIQTECKRLASPNWVRFELFKDSAVVYSTKKIDLSALGLPSCCSKEKADSLLFSVATFMPALRFSLNNEKTRIFSVERRCFMEEDEWYFLESGKLSELIKKYAPHIEKESMFDFI